MNSSRTPRSSLHAANARPRNSGPLSSTIASGNPRFSAIRSSTRRTRNPPNDVSTSMAGHSRVQSSTTVNIRITLPVLTTNPSTSVHSVSLLPCCSPRPPSESAAVAESSSPILPRGTFGTLACDWPQSLPAPASPSAADSRTACAWLPVPSIALATRCLAPLSALDNDASIVPTPPACRRAARLPGTPLPHSSRLPEVPQALPVF